MNQLAESLLHQTYHSKNAPMPAPQEKRGPEQGTVPDPKNWTPPGQFGMENSPRDQSSNLIDAEPAQARLPRAGRAEYIDAEVAAVNRDGVLFNCFLADREVTIQLPKALIPEDLQKFGATVRISLGYRGSVRIPVISARAVEPVKDEFDASMRAWLSGK